VSTRTVVNGVGFGVHGPEENYLLLISDNGDEESVRMSDLLPEDGCVSWAHIEALTDGFSEKHCKDVLAREDAREPRPRAYRLRIVAEVEALDDEETLHRIELVKAKRKL